MTQEEKFDIAGAEWEDLQSLKGEELVDISPAALASTLARLSTSQARELLRRVSEQHASVILSEMEAEAAGQILGEMREWRAIEILEELDPDDAADVVSELEAKDQTRLLEQLEPATSEALKNLLSYDPDTAGGIMTTDVATVQPDMDVDDVIQRIRKLMIDIEHVYYLYVVDEEKHLLGIVSMRQLILARPHFKIKDIMTTNIRGKHLPSADREMVAHDIAAYNLIALPIVNEDNQILGIVTHDDVLDIVNQEATEDLQKLMGAGGDESVNDSIWYSFQMRAPWLCVNLITAFCAAGIIHLFSDQIEKLTLLAVFMTIIPSLGGNTGAQALAVTIRGIALGDAHPNQSFSIALREGLKGMLNGLLVGLIAGTAAYLLNDSVRIGLVITLAMFANMTLAGIAGTSIPFLLKKFGFDPAQSSSVFLTATTDIAGFFIFLSLGSYFLL